MPLKKMIIAIDGFSSCGKSTMAKSLARVLRYMYIDSGAMYRAVTLYALRNNWIKNGSPDIPSILGGLHKISISFDYNQDEERNITYLCGENVEEEIRRLEVSENVSPVSTIPEVRQEMVVLQRKLGENKGIVMDGRDIGTVVFPHADIKIFMTADPEIRAQRRFKELTEKGIKISMEEVRENIARRDFIDQHREVSPLKKADDAIVFDNSYLTPQQQLNWALDIVESIAGLHEN
jgi:cytidylate kinase